ncbi:MAG: hypothetical protein KDH96_01930 [Candidatus Riesia sp.]|nr:hypothetical protein [Candidatus Riesia sp.]
MVDKEDKAEPLYPPFMSCVEFLKLTDPTDNHAYPRSAFGVLTSAADFARAYLRARASYEKWEGQFPPVGTTLKAQFPFGSSSRRFPTTLGVVDKLVADPKYPAFALIKTREGRDNWMDRRVWFCTAYTEEIEDET